MSGLSTSLTFPVPREVAETLLQAIRRDDISELARYATEDLYLHATCRNNHLEHFLRCMVRQFDLPDLAYLGTSTVSLGDNIIQSAIRSLRELISSLRDQPELSASLITNQTGYECSASDVVQAFAAPPESLQEALSRFQNCRSYDEGDDLPTYAAFLYAHLAILEEAHGRNLDAIYALWLY